MPPPLALPPLPPPPPFLPLVPAAPDAPSAPDARLLETATFVSATLPLSINRPPPLASTLGWVELTLPPVSVRFCSFTLRFLPPLISIRRSSQPEPPVRMV